MDRHGQVLAKSNRNSDDEIQSVISGSIKNKNETDVEANSFNMRENYCREGFQAWKNMQQISAQMDTGGHTLL